MERPHEDQTGGILNREDISLLCTGRTKEAMVAAIDRVEAERIAKGDGPYTVEHHASLMRQIEQFCTR